MSAHILAEALARVEFKLDLLLTRMGVHTDYSLPSMEFSYLPCPVCKIPVNTQVDVMNQVVTRTCGCKTGKQPFIVPPLPATQGTTNVRTESVAAEGEVGAADRPRSEAGGRGSGHVR